MKTKGFTLIELLVVIAIIGLLATLSVISFSNTTAKARDVKRHNDLRSIQKALENYFDQNGAYPVVAVWRGVSTNFGSFGVTGATGYIPNLAPTYIAKLPVDPKPMAHPELNPACTAALDSYIYQSDGTQYKLVAHCSLETGPPLASDPMLDPPRFNYSIMVCGPQGNSPSCAW